MILILANPLQTRIKSAFTYLTKSSVFFYYPFAFLWNFLFLFFNYLFLLIWECYILQQYWFRSYFECFSWVDKLEIATLWPMYRLISMLKPTLSFFNYKKLPNKEHERHYFTLSKTTDFLKDNLAIYFTSLKSMHSLWPGNYNAKILI